MLCSYKDGVVYAQRNKVSLLELSTAYEKLEEDLTDVDVTQFPDAFEDMKKIAKTVVTIRGKVGADFIETFLHDFSLKVDDIFEECVGDGTLVVNHDVKLNDLQEMLTEASMAFPQPKKVLDMKEQVAALMQNTMANIVNRVDPK